MRSSPIVKYGTRGTTLFAASLLLFFLSACGGGGGGGAPAPAPVPSALAARLYFAGLDLTNGVELWKSDGTTAGTALLKDIDPGLFSSQPSGFTVFNNALYFSAADALHGSKVWKTDGTAAGTVPVGDINPYQAPVGLTVFNGALYFQAAGGLYGVELWKTDGTAAGTVMVKDINPGAGNSFPLSSSGGYASITVANGALYFSATDGVSGFELWKSDGTAAGTVMVKDINPGAGDSFPLGFAEFTEFNGELYFMAFDDGVSSALWKSDGTAAGTVMVKPVGGDLFTVFNNALYFRGPDGLWKTDGTEAGTAKVTNFLGGSGNPVGFTVFNSALYFSDDELWKTDGTAAGTVMVKDINFTGASDPGDLTVFNNALYFSATDGVHGDELWRTDGTAVGTVQVADINLGAGDSGPHGFTVFNNALYFVAQDATNGFALWKSDGTAAGTVLVNNDMKVVLPSFSPGTLSQLSWFTVFNGAP